MSIAAPSPAEHFCPFVFGGTCLGAIDAGTYTTTTFQPSITYTVPDGWINREDLPGNFLLHLDGNERYLGIYRDATAPLECEEAPAPGVGQSVEAWSDWLTSHPGLVTTEPQPVNVGGLDGVYIDIALDPDWTVTCPYSEGQPVVPFIIGGERRSCTTSSSPASRSASTSSTTTAATSPSRSAPREPACPNTSNSSSRSSTASSSATASKRRQTQ